MPKNTAADITDLGFTKEMFGKEDDTAFEAFITAIISEQAGILEGRIGSTLYADTSLPNATYNKRAEKCFVAAEMVQRRINVILGNVVGNGREIDISHEGAQKNAYLREAEQWISRLVSGGGPDSANFASGALVTGHFGDDDS
jgi:hypothetical protein